VSVEPGALHRLLVGLPVDGRNGGRALQLHVPVSKMLVSHLKQKVKRVLKKLIFNETMHISFIDEDSSFVVAWVSFGLMTSG
jgi:hypothetical protein